MGGGDRPQPHPLQTYRDVVVPQMIPRIVPALGNYLVSMLKETPVLSVVTVLDMLALANMIGERTFEYLVPLSMVGLIFLPMTSHLLGSHPPGGEGSAQKRDSPAMTPIIRFQNVSKRFGALTVLDNFDFEVRPGEKVTLIGPSGSGKSTVLRILMTLEPFQEGHLELAGISYHEPEGAGRVQGQRKAPHQDPLQCRHGVSELQSVSAHDRRCAISSKRRSRC